LPHHFIGAACLINISIKGFIHPTPQPPTLRLVLRVALRLGCVIAPHAYRGAWVRGCVGPCSRDDRHRKWGRRGQKWIMERQKQKSHRARDRPTAAVFFRGAYLTTLPPLDYTASNDRIYMCYTNRLTSV
jgi:hypothetical protein